MKYGPHRCPQCENRRYVHKTETEAPVCEYKHKAPVPMEPTPAAMTRGDMRESGETRRRASCIRMQVAEGRIAEGTYPAPLVQRRNWCPGHARG